MDEGADVEDVETIANDVEDIEEWMKEEIANAAIHIKPVRRVLLKVCSHIIHMYPPDHCLMSPLSAIQHVLYLISDSLQHCSHLTHCNPPYITSHATPYL